MLMYKKRLKYICFVYLLIIPVLSSLSTIEKEDKCKFLAGDEKRITLRNKYTQCYNLYQRDDNLFGYYQCLDNSLNECDLAKKFVEQYQKEQTTGKGNNKSDTEF